MKIKLDENLPASLVAAPVLPAAFVAVPFGVGVLFIVREPSVRH